MTYLYRCRSCNMAFESEQRSDKASCPHCSTTGRRVWAFYNKPAFQEHFNNAVGHHVSNESQFMDALKIKSEEDSYRMGQNVDYQPISPLDMADSAAHGVTDEGLDATRKDWHDNGVPQ